MKAFANGKLNMPQMIGSYYVPISKDWGHIVLQLSLNLDSS